MENNNRVTINGPINIVRLEGNIFGIDKVLYVFFDLHIGCSIETKCQDIFSDDVAVYLTRQFKNTENKTLDFFLETFPIGLDYKSNYRDIYLMELRKLMAHAFKYNPDENKVYQSDVFPYVRLHYIDVRDYLFWRILWTQSDDLMNHYWSFQNTTPTRDQLVNFKDDIYGFSNNISFIIDLFFHQKGGKRAIRQFGEEITPDERKDIVMNLIDKILNRYKHPEVKIIIQKFIKNNLLEGLNFVKDTLQEISRICDDLINLVSVNNSDINPNYKWSETTPVFIKYVKYGMDYSSIHTKLQSIYPLMVDVVNTSKHCSTIIVDAYFLRRFLDKDHITNGISYTGAFHSNTYVYILCKYFDFKITNASYSKYNIGELNIKIKNMEFGYDYSLLLTPPTIYQCSDISDFPQGFA